VKYLETIEIIVANINRRVRLLLKFLSNISIYDPAFWLDNTALKKHLIKSLFEEDKFMDFRANTLARSRLNSVNDLNPTQRLSLLLGETSFQRPTSVRRNIR